MDQKAHREGLKREAGPRDVHEGIPLIEKENTLVQVERDSKLKAAGSAHYVSGGLGCAGEHPEVAAANEDKLDQEEKDGAIPGGGQDQDVADDDQEVTDGNGCAHEAVGTDADGSQCDPAHVHGVDGVLDQVDPEETDGAGSHEDDGTENDDHVNDDD